MSGALFTTYFRVRNIANLCQDWRFSKRSAIEQRVNLIVPVTQYFHHMQNRLLVSSMLYNSSPKRFTVALRGRSRFRCSLTQSVFLGFLTWISLTDRISNSLLSDLVCLVSSRVLSFIVEIWPLFFLAINRWFLSDVARPFHSFSSYIYLNLESHLVGGAKNWWRNEPDLKRGYNFILFKKHQRQTLISHSQRYPNEYLWDDALITLYTRCEDFSTNGIQTLWLS